MSSSLLSLQLLSASPLFSHFLRAFCHSLQKQSNDEKATEKYCHSMNICSPISAFPAYVPNLNAFAFPLLRTICELRMKWLFGRSPLQQQQQRQLCKLFDVLDLPVHSFVHSPIHEICCIAALLCPFPFMSSAPFWYDPFVLHNQPDVFRGYDIYCPFVCLFRWFGARNKLSDVRVKLETVKPVGCDSLETETGRRQRREGRIVAARNNRAKSHSYPTA